MVRSHRDQFCKGGAPAIRRVGFLSALGGISGDAATIALARRCAALQFIINGRMGAANILSDTAQGHPLLMQSLNHSPLSKREMTSGFTNNLIYVKMVSIHSDAPLLVIVVKTILT